MKIYNEETETLKKKFYGVQTLKLVLYVLLATLILVIPISAFMWVVLGSSVALFFYVSIGASIVMWLYSAVADLADEIEWELSSREEKVFTFRFRW